MEKPCKLRARFLAFLPKSVTPVTFQKSPPRSPYTRSPSPRRSPVVPIIPAEVRREPKTDSFVGWEPNSPEISCTGRVKIRKKKSLRKSKIGVPPAVHESKPNSYEKTKQGQKPKARSVDDKEASFGLIKQYASGRTTLGNFNWKDVVEEETKRK